MPWRRIEDELPPEGMTVWLCFKTKDGSYKYNIGNLFHAYSGWSDFFQCGMRKKHKNLFTHWAFPQPPEE